MSIMNDDYNFNKNDTYFLKYVFYTRSYITTIP